MISFSMKGACSYAWHRNNHDGDSAIVNVFKCLITLVCAVFKQYEVKEFEVATIYKSNQKTIFGKEYQKQIHDRKVEVQINTLDSNPNKNIVAHADEKLADHTDEKLTAHADEKLTDHADENKQDDTDVSVNNRSSSNDSKMKKQVISAYNLRRFIDNGNISPDIHYIVEGDLKFKVATYLTELPDHLTVKGELDLYSCWNLERLPTHLTVTGNLNLSKCTKLTTLPEYLNSFEGNLTLFQCTNLTSVPKKLKASGNIDFEGCSSLVIPPEEIHAGCDIDFSNCCLLQNLPGKLYAGRDLVTTLPIHEKIVVKGRILKKA